MKIPTIRPEELEALRKRGEPVELIDVRTPLEFRAVHAEAARLVPLDRLDGPAVKELLEGTGGSPIYLICRSGGRSLKAARKLVEAGGLNVVNVEGGMLAWERAGLPVFRGEPMISLERQVRIAAGSLVVTGTALGLLVHPGFFGLSAFVGAGLVFAGITDTCGMGLLLALMPWNQGGPAVADRSTEQARS
jgi:rhodanese-related sulfurtransferase